MYHSPTERLEYDPPVAWNTQETRQKLLAAASTHFSRSGFAGGRVEASINKERIYQYFGNKEGLFAAVLESEVERLLDGIDITGAGADALGTLAGDLFDRAAQHPRLVRLLLWESLELAEPVSASTRGAGCARMVAALEQAVPRSDARGGADTLLSVIGIAFADTCLPHLSRLISGSDSPEDRRSAVVQQARRLA